MGCARSCDLATGKAESCSLPGRAEGAHQDRDASLSAVQETTLRKILRGGLLFRKLILPPALPAQSLVLRNCPNFRNTLKKRGFSHRVTALCGFQMTDRPSGLHLWSRETGSGHFMNFDHRGRASRCCPSPGGEDSIGSGFERGDSPVREPDSAINYP